MMEEEKTAKGRGKSTNVLCWGDVISIDEVHVTGQRTSFGVRGFLGLCCI